MKLQWIPRNFSPGVNFKIRSNQEEFSRSEIRNSADSCNLTNNQPKVQQIRVGVTKALFINFSIQDIFPYTNIRYIHWITFACNRWCCSMVATTPVKYIWDTQNVPNCFDQSENVENNRTEEIGLVTPITGLARWIPWRQMNLATIKCHMRFRLRQGVHYVAINFQV